MYTSFTTGIQGRGWRITNQLEAYRGDSMVCVVLNLSTEEDSVNLGEKGWGKRYMALPQSELTVN